MRKRIFHNWGLKLVSLLLAFVFWFFAVQINDPKDTATFSGIPVRLTNTDLLEQENKVYEVLDTSDIVRVTIRAPKSVIRDLRSSDIVAVADMRKLTDINTIAITYSIQGVPSANYDSIKGDHDMVRLSVEERTSKLIRVQSRAEGEPAAGYLVMGATADQNMISVTGPKSAVEKVSFARVEVDVSGASTGMSLNVEPMLYDVNGNLLELPGVSMNVSYIHMTVEVLAVKEVPVLLAAMGTPAEGYLATGELKCDPETVKIAGSAMVIAGINNISIPAEQLDISGAQGDVVNTINVKDFLRNDVKLADSTFSGRLTVTAYVEAVVYRIYALTEKNLELRNLPKGYQAELVWPEEAYQMKISGLQRTVAALEKQTVTGRVDIGAWFEEHDIRISDGEYMIPVRFDLPDDTVSVEELSVKIRLKKSEDE